MPDEDSALRSSTQRRVVRVFVSSTFLDMEEERNELVLRIFPALRKICERRGVVWGEVDLRWGITDEQRAEGKVLPICLEEIRRSRPYFIGILGERYGWTAGDIPPDAIEREPWLSQHTASGTSVTELEILHGVLNQPAMAENAFFYFRDPKYVDEAPVNRRHEFASESEEASEKLKRLKQRIRDSGLPVREPYANPKALGELVRRDLTGVVDRLFPPDQPEDPLERDWTEHVRYAETRARVYVGRAEYFDRLDDYLRDGGPPLAVLGEPGIGKSALLANWYRRHREDHPDEFAFVHFVDATAEGSDYTRILQRLVGELRPYFRLPGRSSKREKDPRSEFSACLTQLYGAGRVLLIFDGLDQLADRDDGPDLGWLPTVFPGNFRVVFSARPGRALDAAKARGWLTATRPLEIGRLDEAERRRLISEVLDGRELGPERTDRLTRAPQTGNPLFLRAVLDELRQAGVHERLDEQLTDYLGAETPKELYLRILARWEAVYSEESELPARALRVIATARYGLSEAELLELLGENGHPLPQGLWAPFYLAAETGLAICSGRLTLAHEFFRQAVRERYLGAESLQQETHRRLYRYFDGIPEWTERRIDEAPWHLYQSGELRLLAEMLGDVPILSRLYERNRADVMRYWSALEGTSTATMAETYRPILADAACHIDHLGPLGDILTEAGHLGEARAVRRFEAEHYRAVGDLHRARRAQLNLAVVTYRHGDGDEALSLYRELLGLCRATNDLDELQACHGNLGNVFLDRGDDTNALLQYEMQETLCGRLGIEEGLQASLGNQGNVWRKRGRFATALAKYRKQEEICRRTRNDIGLLNSLNSQTGILLETGEISPPEAMRRLKEFERQARELGLAESLLLNLERQASLLERNVDLEGALQRRQEAEAIAGRGLSREAQGDFYYRMACSLLGTGDELGGPLSGVSDLSALEKQSRFFGRRLEYDETGVGYLRKAIEYHPQHAEAHFALGLALERQRRLGEAAEAYETALRLRPGWTDAKIRLASVLVDLEET